MYLLSRVMQTSRRVAVVERQLKQQQTKTDDVDIQLNYLLMKAAQVSPPPSPPQVARPEATAPPARSQPPSIPFPGNVTLVDMSPEMLMPPGFMNLFCGLMDGMDEVDAKTQTSSRVEEVVEVAAAAVGEAKEEEKKPEPFIDSSSSSSSSDSEEEQATKEEEEKRAPPRRAAGRGGGRGRGKKATLS